MQAGAKEYGAACAPRLAVASMKPSAARPAKTNFFIGLLLGSPHHAVLDVSSYCESCFGIDNRLDGRMAAQNTV